MMKMDTVEDLLKYHRTMKARSKNTTSMIGHHDALQTLYSCVELPVSVLGPYSRQWAFETLAHVFSEAAAQELEAGFDGDFPEEREALKATHRLLVGMAEAAMNAALRPILHD